MSQIWAIDPRAMVEMRQQLASIPPALLADLKAGKVEAPKAFGLFSSESDREREKCYRVLDDGTAVVSMAGPIYSDTAPWWRVMLTGGITYGAIVAAVREALADGLVSRVVIECDTPGGMVSGVVEARAALMAMKGGKPILAHAMRLESAGYWFAAASDGITASPTAPVGNLGALIAVTDDTEALKMEGLVRYVVVNGDSPRKRPDLKAADGLDDYRAQVEAVFDAFVANVAEDRGVDEAWVRESMGRGASLIGPAAIEAKLIDALSVGIPPMASEDSESGLEVTYSQPGLLPAARTDGGVPMAEKATQAAAQSTADPREGQILALTAERDRFAAEADAAKLALQAMNKRAEEAEGKLAAQAKVAKDAAITACLDRHIARGAILPASRAVWQAQADAGVDVDALLSTLSGTARPVGLNGGDNATGPEGSDAPKDQQDLADLASKAVAAKQYPDFPAAMKALAQAHPEAARVLKANFGGAQ